VLARAELPEPPPLAGEAATPEPPEVATAVEADGARADPATAVAEPALACVVVAVVDPTGIA